MICVFAGSGRVGSISSGAKGMESSNDLESVQSLIPDTCLIPSGGGLPPILVKITSNRG